MIYMFNTAKQIDMFYDELIANNIDVDSSKHNFSVDRGIFKINTIDNVATAMASILLKKYKKCNENQLDKIKDWFGVEYNKIDKKILVYTMYNNSDIKDITDGRIFDDIKEAKEYFYQLRILNLVRE